MGAARTGWFCSELVAGFLKAVGVLGELDLAHTYWPGHFAQAVSLRDGAYYTSLQVLDPT